MQLFSLGDLRLFCYIITRRIADYVTSNYVEKSPNAQRNVAVIS